MLNENGTNISSQISKHSFNVLVKERTVQIKIEMMQSILGSNRNTKISFNKSGRQYKIKCYQQAYLIQLHLNMSEVKLK